VMGAARHDNACSSRHRLCDEKVAAEAGQSRSGRRTKGDRSLSPLCSGSKEIPLCPQFLSKPRLASRCRIVVDFAPCDLTTTKTQG
jgi:hypothetical protein